MNLGDLYEFFINDSGSGYLFTFLFIGLLYWRHTISELRDEIKSGFFIIIGSIYFTLLGYSSIVFDGGSIASIITIICSVTMFVVGIFTMIDKYKYKKLRQWYYDRNESYYE